MTLKLNLTLTVKVNHPQNNRDLNQGILHLWSKFDDPSLNGDELSRSWLTPTRADAGNDYTRRPKWHRVKKPTTRYLFVIKAFQPQPTAPVEYLVIAFIKPQSTRILQCFPPSSCPIWIAALLCMSMRHLVGSRTTDLTKPATKPFPCGLFNLYQTSLITH